MRRMKRASLLALGVVPLLLLTAFLPAGAVTKEEGKPGRHSSELVVCETDASGIIESVRVFDTLGVPGSGGGSVDIMEKYNFAGEEPSKITGFNSFAKPAVDGDYLVWKGIDTGTDTNTVADVKFSKAMVEEAKTRIPLKISYQYYFDGKKVSGPKDIAGKTGHFRMEATFTNVSGESVPVAYKDPATGETLYQKTDVYLPLVIQPYDWKFDNNHFFNLQADPMAVIIPKPDVTQPGWTIPLFPPATDAKQGIWVEADVKDFRMPALALVVAFVFPHTNQANALDQLGPGLNDLYGGIRQLDEGLNTAVAGLGTAATPDTLLYGIGKIYDGLLQLSAEGIDKLEGGVNGQLIPGIHQLYGGTDQILGGLGTAKGGIEQLEDGIDLLMAKLSSGSAADPGFKEALQELIDGINLKLIPNLQYIRSRVGPASASGTLLNQIDGLIANFTVDNSALFPGPLPPPSGLTMYGFVNNLAKFSGTMGGTSVPFISGQMAGMASQLSAGRPDIVAMYDGLGDGTDPDTQIIGGLFRMSSVLTYLANGIGDAATPETILNGLARLKMGLITLGAGIGSTADENSLMGGVSRIKFGLNGEGIGSQGILQGLRQISEGLAQIDSSAIGSASTPNTLLYAANAVGEGLGDLQGGLVKATEGGTQVMLTGLDGSLKTINLTQGELAALEARAGEFDSFLGSPTDGESMVRFIYQTPAVYGYSDGNSTSHWVAVVLSIIIAAGLVLAGALLFRKLA